MRSNRGFTLLELAVVLVIIGTMLTLGIAAFNAQTTTSAYARTKARMEAVRDALVFFLARSGRLPCPDEDFDGEEDDCNPLHGTLPFRTLGLSRDAVFDGWEHYIYYRVDDGWRTEKVFKVTDVGDSDFKILDQSGNPLAEALVAVLQSAGRNGLGAYTSKGGRATLPVPSLYRDEYENADDNQVFVARAYTEREDATGGPFDDVVLGVSSADVLSPLVHNGQMKRWQLDEAFKRLEAVVVGAAVNGGCVLPTAASIPTVADPWGRALEYNDSDGTSIDHAAVGGPAAPAAELKSKGPDDGVTGDDETWTISKASFLAAATDYHTCGAP
jgi:prepilin-type N-terminal cleavage/methylation domain-containing protein